MRLAREAADADATFSPAVCDRSLRLALAKQIRELRDELPAAQRLSAARALPAAAQGGQPPHPPMPFLGCLPPTMSIVFYSLVVGDSTVSRVDQQHCERWFLQGGLQENDCEYLSEHHTLACA